MNVFLIEIKFLEEDDEYSWVIFSWRCVMDIIVVSLGLLLGLGM